MDKAIYTNDIYTICPNCQSDRVYHSDLPGYQKCEDCYLLWTELENLDRDPGVAPEPEYIKDVDPD
ncbi:MAG: hypothetical protein ACRC2R_11575 [Xenococcaceae cyanobacterium]